MVLVHCGIVVNPCRDESQEPDAHHPYNKVTAEAGRHLLAGAGIDVDFSIETASADAATKVATAIKVSRWCKLDDPSACSVSK